MHKIERRTYEYEVKASGQDGENRKITGYAAVFNQESQEMWGFKEIIEPGAFDEVLGDDVRALFNHDPNYILARTASGTLKLSVDEKGLQYSFEIPDTTFGNDFRVMVDRGDINQSSFGFTIAKDRWEEDHENQTTTRYIEKVSRLYDVSPVTYPAYEQTEVSLRSFNDFKNEKQKPEDQNIRKRKIALLRLKK